MEDISINTANMATDIATNASSQTFNNTTESIRSSSSDNRVGLSSIREQIIGLKNQGLLTKMLKIALEEDPDAFNSVTWEANAETESRESRLLRVPSYRIPKQKETDAEYIKRLDTVTIGGLRVGDFDPSIPWEDPSTRRGFIYFAEVLQEVILTKINFFTSESEKEDGRKKAYCEINALELFTWLVNDLPLPDPLDVALGPNIALVVKALYTSCVEPNTNHLIVHADEIDLLRINLQAFERYFKNVRIVNINRFNTSEFPKGFYTPAASFTMMFYALSKFNKTLDDFLNGLKTFYLPNTAKLDDLTMDEFNKYLDNPGMTFTCSNGLEIRCLMAVYFSIIDPSTSTYFVFDDNISMLRAKDLLRRPPSNLVFDHYSNFLKLNVDKPSKSKKPLKNVIFEFNPARLVKKEFGKINISAGTRSLRYYA